MNQNYSGINNNVSEVSTDTLVQLGDVNSTKSSSKTFSNLVYIVLNVILIVLLCLTFLTIASIFNLTDFLLHFISKDLYFNLFQTILYCSVYLIPIMFFISIFMLKKFKSKKNIVPKFIILIAIICIVIRIIESIIGISFLLFN